MGVKGTSSLTCKIKCMHCGGNYSAETSSGMRYWRCTRGRDGLSLREDVLQSVIANVMGLESYSESVVNERIEKICVDGQNLIFKFKDGSEEIRVWENPKKRGHKISESQKELMSRLMHDRWTPEYRAEMSRKMSELRKERGTAWRKA